MIDVDARLIKQLELFAADTTADLRLQLLLLEWWASGWLRLPWYLWRVPALELLRSGEVFPCRLWLAVLLVVLLGWLQLWEGLGPPQAFWANELSLSLCTTTGE